MNTLAKNVVIIGFILLSILWSISSYKNPAYNFDMINYMGCILKIDGIKDESLIHQKVYEELKTIPPEKYELLTDKDSEFVHTIHEDYVAFSQQRPWFEIKFIYNYINFIIYKITNDLVRSTFISSIIAFMLISLLLIKWISINIDNKDWPLLFTALIFIFPVSHLLTLSKFSTPDALASFFIFLSFYLLVVKKKIHAAIIVLIISIGVHMDHLIILVFVLIAYRFIIKKLSNKQFLIYLAMASLFFLGLYQVFHYYSWATFVHYNFVNPIIYPEEFVGTVSIIKYLGYLWNIRKLTASQYLIFSCFSFVLIYYAVKYGKIKINHELILPLILINLSWFARFSLFPVVWDRYYVGYYLVIAAIIIQIIRRNFRHIEIVKA